MICPHCKKEIDYVIVDCTANCYEGFDENGELDGDLTDFEMNFIHARFCPICGKELDFYK